jgi:hypothetical protein
MLDDMIMMYIWMRIDVYTNLESIWYVELYDSDICVIMHISEYNFRIIMMC